MTSRDLTTRRGPAHGPSTRSLARQPVPWSGLHRGHIPRWAWGDLGHKIICEIAFQELNDKTRNEVIRSIALDDTFKSLADACTWLDHPRKRAEEHFVN